MSRAGSLRSLIPPSAASLAERLSSDEIDDIEGRLDFRFGPDHRQLLEACLPLGERWPDWRHGTDSELRSRLEWPVHSVMFHVEGSEFWPRSWGERPVDFAAALDIARDHLDRVPKLVPVCSHRFLPAAPCAPAAPVFSVYGTDTVYYGANLEDYLEREFVVGARGRPFARRPSYVRFWSELAESRHGDL